MHLYMCRYVYMHTYTSMYRHIQAGLAQTRKCTLTCTSAFAYTYTYTCMSTQDCKHSHEQANQQSDKKCLRSGHTDKQTDRQTDRLTNKQSSTYKHTDVETIEPTNTQTQNTQKHKQPDSHKQSYFFLQLHRKPIHASVHQSIIRSFVHSLKQTDILTT